MSTKQLKSVIKKVKNAEYDSDIELEDDIIIIRRLRDTYRILEYQNSKAMATVLLFLARETRYKLDTKAVTDYYITFK